MLGTKFLMLRTWCQGDAQNVFFKLDNRSAINANQSH